MPPSEPSRPLRTGLLGCADIAVRRVLPVLAALPEAELTAVASRTPEKAARVAARFGGAPVTGYDTLLARDDVDAVYLALPTGMHAAWIRRALAAGKHVLAEKPLTTTHAEAVELTEAARDAGLVLRENLMFVHHSQHVAVREMVADGVIGELRAFRAAFTIPARPPDDIRYVPELGGGALLDVAAYPLRAARIFLGDDLTVAGAWLRHDSVTGVDVGGAALLVGDAAVPAQLSWGMEHSYRSSYELHGSTGRLSLEHAFTTPADHQPVVRLERSGARELVRLAVDDQYTAAVTAFVRDVTGRNLGGTAATVGQAALVDAIGATRTPAHRTARAAG